MGKIPDIYSAYQAMEKDGILLSFKGQVTKDLLSSVYQIMEFRMNSLGEDPKRRKKVYNILVESLQNVYHHMDEWKVEAGADTSLSSDAMFMIVKHDDGSYTIHTGNFVQNGKCDILRKRIDEVNAMSPEELRSHYVDRLSTTEYSDKGGAGLGIIDIARKSGNKLGYSFNKASENFTFFSMVVTIS